ncbi:hypothetical protein [Streptomyces solaniscabiei]|uniref:hypothetical protein n=1 Tax=Streptomyces solaniscabiei TaxID=2683255 RepID=UPI001CE2DAC2|nr:hypothetical protein [Streptomyces solaniscabiei]
MAAPSVCAIQVLRISVGVVHCWFGVLKVFPAGSPNRGDHRRPPMGKLTCQALIGLALVTGLLLRPALALFFLHMAGVLTSLALLPERMWHHGVPTLEGQ